jgi:alpha-L-rhamnosidase
VVAGIDTYEDGPGYKHISIHPHTGGGLSFASADLQTYYGKISSHWRSENGELLIDVEIPANTTADVFLHGENVDAITENGNGLASIKDIKISGKQNDCLVVQLGSGVYHFVIKK